MLVASGAAAVGVSACGLVLGIDPIPAVTGFDAGVDAKPAVMDARHDHAVDAGVDARHDQGVDAGPGQDVSVNDAEGGLPQPSGSPTTSDAGINFAMHYLWLGDTDQSSAFMADPSAWETFGYNIDGKITTSASTDVCTLAQDAPSTVQTDGMDGADNSFGLNIVGGLAIVFAGVSKNLSSRIAAGGFTILLDTTGLSPDPSQTNTGLTAGFFAGAEFPGIPTFTLADNWPVAAATLSDGVSLANGAKISFFEAYISNGTWVSGEPTDIVVAVEIQGQPFAITIHEGVVTFRHTIDDAGANHALSGMIAGVLKPSEFNNALKSAAADLNNGAYCPEFENFASRITTAQDIMLNGTNTPGQPCNGISVALGFSADQIQLPSKVTPSTIPDGAAPTCPGDSGP